jgi:alkanesulfonate monooxygenase SsuD/methylene tetrahydromethanopterin reductase-like flavin-dependent oxidoreductase (luciferase family)
MMMVFASYGWENCSDARVWDEEIRLARLAADLGFDCLWSAEHHFNDYSFVPDNLQLMTYLTALCPDIDLGTAAVILPWHDPLRVAEQAAVLDMLSKGRLRLGLGRGLARREFAAFRLSMDESRERFDEAAPMIVSALTTGFIEGDGKFYKQPRIEIRPRPQHSFDGRIYAVASSEDSIDSAAKLGAHVVMFADRPWEMRLPNIESGRELHRKYHGTEPPQVMLTEFCVCGTNLAETEEEARRYQGKFVESNFYHYEFLGEHFKTVKGYDAYQQKAEIARKGGLDGAVNGFMQAASWGTPDKILRGLEERRKIIGDFELNVAFRFGGTPHEVAERGLKLFAKEVLPVLKSQSSQGSGGGRVSPSPGRAEMPVRTSEPVKFDAIIVGAGVGGLYAIYRLRKLGLRVRAFETGTDVGGTWYWNRYPGCRCDVESMEYSYSFFDELQQEWHWPERYGTQPEILRYINHVADRFDLRRDIEFNARVKRRPSIVRRAPGR